MTQCSFGKPWNTHTPRLRQIRFRNLKNLKYCNIDISEKRSEFFPVGMKEELEECVGIILLGDNTSDGAVLLLPKVTLVSILNFSWNYLRICT
jgi:hypothetical protein